MQLSGSLGLGQQLIGFALLDPIKFSLQLGEVRFGWLLILNSIKKYLIQPNLSQPNLIFSNSSWV